MKRPNCITCNKPLKNIMFTRDINFKTGKLEKATGIGWCPSCHEELAGDLPDFFNGVIDFVDECYRCGDEVYRSESYDMYDDRAKKLSDKSVGEILSDHSYCEDCVIFLLKEYAQAVEAELKRLEANG